MYEETYSTAPRWMNKKNIKRVLIGFVVLVVLTGSFGTVSAGQRGVLTQFGAVTGKVYDEGLYMKVPFIQQVVKMDVQINKAQTEASSSSKDLQSVQTTIAVNYHLKADSVDNIYQDFRRDYGERVIGPVIQETVKSSTAKFTAEELITKRSEVRDDIRLQITEKLGAFGIGVDDVNIVNFSFSSSFNSAIEAKVTAEQDALAAKNKLEQIKFEAQQKIEAAKGSAEAIRIESRALANNASVLELRAIEKWDGVMPQVTGGAVPFINLK